jgi:hypothetical protein
MKVVTVATHPDRYFNSLLDSAKKNNIEITVLGMGEKWQGFKWKLTLMKEFLKNNNPYEIVVFIDAYDVIFLQDLNKLKEEFIKAKNIKDFKIFIGVDSDLESPVFKYAYNKIFMVKKNPYKINSGVYVGYAKDILDVIEEIDRTNVENITDDQVLLVKQYIRNPETFYFDTKRTVILNLFGNIIDGVIDLDKNGYKIAIKNGKRVLIDENNESPVILHAPGNGNIDSIVEKLGYILDNKDKFNRIDYLSKVTTYQIKHIHTEITLSIVILLLFTLISYIIYKKIN